ncbi:pentapeptide repeat-containing protein [Gordonia jacobaea]|uniref:pentapeptide repeat-containing protein n=1 Tax=Gordonia jacobaea TaxID=122202 RepID=UPI003D750BFC
MGRRWCFDPTSTRGTSRQLVDRGASDRCGSEVLGHPGGDRGVASGATLTTADVVRDLAFLHVLLELVERRCGIAAPPADRHDGLTRRDLDVRRRLRAVGRRRPGAVGVLEQLHQFGIGRRLATRTARTHAATERARALGSAVGRGSAVRLSSVGRLIHSRLSRTRLRGAVLRCAILRAAVLRGAVLRAAVLRAAVLRGAVLCAAASRAARTTPARSAHATLNAARLYCCRDRPVVCRRGRGDRECSCPCESRDRSRDHGSHEQLLESERTSHEHADHCEHGHSADDPPTPDRTPFVAVEQDDRPPCCETDHGAQRNSAVPVGATSPREYSTERNHRGDSRRQRHRVVGMDDAAHVAEDHRGDQQPATPGDNRAGLGAMNTVAIVEDREATDHQVHAERNREECDGKQPRDLVAHLRAEESTQARRSAEGTSCAAATAARASARTTADASDAVVAPDEIHERVVRRAADVGT